MKIEFKGNQYVFLGKDLNESGALAYLEHCDENENIRFEHVLSESFAHYYPKSGIFRFGKKIGDWEDIKILPPN